MKWKNKEKSVNGCLTPVLLIFFKAFVFSRVKFSLYSTFSTEMISNNDPIKKDFRQAIQDIVMEVT
jgi:hypothetical protein